MLNRFFKDPSTLHRLSDGPAGPFLDGFGEALLAQRFSVRTCCSHLSAAAHLGEWAERRGVAMADLDESLVFRFVRHLPRCRCRGPWRCGRKGVPFRVHKS